MFIRYFIKLLCVWNTKASLLTSKIIWDLLFLQDEKNMHLHWERSHNTAGDCNIRSLSWMGRVPDEIPQVLTHFCQPFFLWRKFLKDQGTPLKVEKALLSKETFFGKEEKIPSYFSAAIKVIKLEQIFYKNLVQDA